MSQSVELSQSVEEFRLPDLGEGLTEGEWVSWSVQTGDRIELNQVIGEVETAKATVELPSPYAGTVAELLVAPGETIPVGSPLLRIAVGAAPHGDAQTPGRSTTEAPSEGRPAVLVGYGPGAAPVSRRAARGRPPETAPDHAAVPVHRPDARPGARREAALRGVDLSDVPGTGPGGVITTEDVRRAAGTDGKEAVEHTRNGSASTSPTTRVPIRGVRKRTADAVTRSAFTAPHATVFLTCDVTGTVDLVTRLRSEPAFDGRHLTALTIVARALIRAIADEPSLNSRWDDAAGEIVVHRDVHLGIAAATPDGLKVPVVRDTARLPLPDLAGAIAEAADRARTGRASPAELTGSTVSVTNIGVFGIEAGTPILNPGEAAILAVGAIADRPWVIDGALAVRKVVSLSLSFDHRLVDGEQAGRALAGIGRFLGDPVPALLGSV
ncbi:dihydrolipoamide acetyltransferase family protein [Rhodococcus coprophilus]|uniref:dihydrolipoamide acetyltransferase family protein n=1 Tax=Rhodococcus coprophilus TaxID=38310 RepID=UPI0033C3FBE8